MVECILVDYSNPSQASDLLEMLNSYACDPMGGAAPLKPAIKEQLTDELAKRPYAFSVLAYVDGKPAGMANCFEGFSTFKCKPLINIHDLAVAPEYRGQKISQHLLKKIEHLAKEKGCCKITLEVLQGNIVARQAYLRFGFEGYQLDPEQGLAEFWQKNL